MEKEKYTKPSKTKYELLEDLFYEGKLLKAGAKSELANLKAEEIKRLKDTGWIK